MERYRLPTGGGGRSKTARVEPDPRPHCGTVWLERQGGAIPPAAGGGGWSETARRSRSTGHGSDPGPVVAARLRPGCGPVVAARLRPGCGPVAARSPLGCGPGVDSERGRSRRRSSRAPGRDSPRPLLPILYHMYMYHIILCCKYIYYEHIINIYYTNIS